MRLTEEQALRIMNAHDALVFKVAYNSGHGRGVRKIEKAMYQEALHTWKKDFVVQKVLRQHPFFASYNSSSVNIVRITTLNLHGEVMVLGAVLRIGPPGSFCDLVSSGGSNPLVIGLDEKGQLGDKAVDVEAIKVYHDVFGKEISGAIPAFGEMVSKVLSLHEKLPKCKLIGWDMTVDEKGEIVCVEYNPQVPGVIQTQLADGPVFGKKLKNGKTVLEELISLE